jgi:hypothetical protein
VKLKGWLLDALAISAVYFAASSRMKMAEKWRIIREFNCKLFEREAR